MCSYGKLRGNTLYSGLGHSSSDLCNFGRDGRSVAGCQEAAVLSGFLESQGSFIGQKNAGLAAIFWMLAPSGGL